MDAQPNALAMFPLGTVLFPGVLLPLHVFEPRYRVMVRETLGGTGEFGVVLIERGHEVGGGDTRFDVGTKARIARCEELPDGRFALAVVGVARVRVVRWLADDPYPRAEVVDLDEGPDDAHSDALAARARGLANEFVELLRRLEPDVAMIPLPGPVSGLEPEADPRDTAFVLSAALPWGALDAQRLLAADGTTPRLELLAALLDEEIAVARARLDEH
jgi:Lon protease-like protein